jgi:hypothetical protein
MTFDSFLAFPPHVLGISAFVLALILVFIGIFLVPGIRFWFLLRRINAQLKTIKVERRWGDLGEVFKPDTTLAHLWSQYKETLHEQKQLNAQTGVIEVIALRSSYPCSAFDSQLISK